MIQINKATVVKLFSKNISSDKSHFISNLIISNSSSELITAITEILLTDETPQLFEVGDYFKVKPPYGHKNVKFFEDKLTDLGLYVNDMVFGYVVSSHDWNDDHDPFHIKVKCKLLYGDEETCESTFSIFEIQKVSKESIPHFNGQYLTRIIDRSPEGISSVSPDDIS